MDAVRNWWWIRAGGADVVIYSGDAVEEVFWWEDGSSVAFYDGIQWHLVRGPQTAPVVVVNPVPRVLERRSFLLPQLSGTETPSG